MGDHIVALGHDTTTTPNGGTTNSLAVSLIDVTAGQAPQLLSRVPVGEGWGWVPSTADNCAQIFKVLPQNNLVMLPFQSWSSVDYRYIGGVQLIDYTRTKLTKRGLIDNAGWVERGIPENDTTILTLSDEIFQVADITDRDTRASAAASSSRATCRTSRRSRKRRGPALGRLVSGQHDPRRHAAQQPGCGSPNRRAPRAGAVWTALRERPFAYVVGVAVGSELRDADSGHRSDDPDAAEAPRIGDAAGHGLSGLPLLVLGLG